MNVPTIAAAVLLLSVSGALADGARGPAPSAPIDVRAALAGGGGTIAGTVVEVGRSTALVADDTGSVRVETGRCAPPKVGEMLTATGRIEHGRMEATQVVREDGSATVDGRRGRGHRG